MPSCESHTMQASMSRKRICVSIFRRFNSFTFISFEKEKKIDVDGDTLVDFFKTEMRLSDQDVRTKRVIQQDDIDNELTSLKNDSERYDFFIFVLLAKLSEDGADRLVFDDPRNPISLDYIFNKIKDPAFVMKPKLFFIQADDDKLVPRKEHYKGGERVQIQVKKIPTDADRLVIMSTIPQELAQPSIINDIMQYFESGGKLSSPKPMEKIARSFLIQTIVDVLKENKADGNNGTDLFCLTPSINGKMREKINELQEKRKKVMTNENKEDGNDGSELQKKRKKVNDRFKSETEVLEKLQVPLVSSTLTKAVFLF